MEENGEQKDLPLPQTNLPMPEKEIVAKTDLASQGETFRSYEGKSVFKSKWLKIGIILVVLVLLMGGVYTLGRNSVFKELNPTNPAIPSPAPVVYEPTTTPDPTADWQTYTVSEIGLEYKIPPTFPHLTKSVSNGDTGTSIYISSSPVNQITLGTTSINFTLGRGGRFVDLQGYTKQGSNYFAKFVSGKSFEISPGLATEIVNKNGVKILKVMGKNFDADPNGLPESGTPGEGNIGALINSSNSTYPGFAIDMELKGEYNEKLFDQILSTFKFTDSNLSSAPIPNTASNLKAYNSACGFSLSYPNSWSVKKYFITDSEEQCAYLTASNYSIETDSRTGFYLGVKKIKLGSKGLSYTINSLEDYVKDNESLVSPSTKVNEKINKTYGSLNGISYLPLGYEPGRSFIFIKDSYLYNINWSDKEETKYVNEISEIIKSIKFTQ